mgnify:CR=1 FL=1
MLLKPGDVVAVSDKAKKTKAFENLNGRAVSAWLTVDIDNLKGTVALAPERADVDIADLKETLIVELYSK